MTKNSDGKRGLKKNDETKGGDKSVLMHQEYHGPLPPSTEFRKYEDVLPGAADRIMKMAEKSLDAEVEDARRYRVVVFISMLLNKMIIYVLIVLAFILLIMGKNIEAFCTGLLPLIQVLSTIDFGKKKK
ncbi:DUF2335 domain-containing protein [Candidatus Saccharibacteria bacterium]|nr:DUF2335 domain-containing protein [Candidatus Saccharibacteria bacterium]